MKYPHGYCFEGDDSHILMFEGDVPRVGDEVSLCECEQAGDYVVTRVRWFEFRQRGSQQRCARVSLKRVS